MKWLFLLLVMISCSTYQIPKTVDEIPDIELPPETEIAKPSAPVTQPVVPRDEVKVTPVVKPAPVAVQKPVKINIVSLTGFTDAQEVKFRKIVANCEVVLNSKEFKDAILAHTWQGKRQFVDTKDTNEQVLAKLLSKDWQVEYRLEYKMFGSTIGYTMPDVSWIVIYTKFFNSMEDSGIADNIFHEYGGHKLGRYDHAMNWSESRDYSAPYGIGYIAEKIYSDKFESK